MVLPSEYHACVVAATNHSFGGDSSKTRGPFELLGCVNVFNLMDHG